MAYTFESKPVATIKGKVTGTENTVSVQGTNPTSTPENAKTQIDRVLALVGTKTVALDGMTQHITKEAVNNG